MERTSSKVKFCGDPRGGNSSFVCFLITLATSPRQQIMNGQVIQVQIASTFEGQSIFIQFEAF